MNNNILESSNDQIDLKSLLKDVYLQKTLLLVTLLLSTLTSYLVSLTFDDVFESKAIVSFQEEDYDLGNLDSSNLFSLAFQGLGSSSKSEDVFFETILSDFYIEKFLLERDLVWKILSLEKWDASTSSHIFDNNLYDSQTNRWLKESEEPYPKKAVKAFKKILFIDRNYASGVYSFSLRTISPDFSFSWLNWYLMDINNYFRDEEIKNKSKSIQFLENKINQTNNIEIKRVFYNVIQEQTKELMLAEVNEEYFIKIIDKPQKAYLKFGPNRLMIVAITLVVTLFLFIFFIALLSFFNRKIGYDSSYLFIKIQKK